MIKNKLHPHHKLSVALTGGIACGKSFVLNCFKKLGFLTYNSDEIVSQLYNNDAEVISQIANLFPKAVINNKVDKKTLSEYTFQNPQALEKIEKIVHPAVKRERDKIIKENKSRCIIFEIPLLFEIKQEKSFDAVISVLCAPEIQKNRAFKRINMTEEKFNAILKRQCVDAERIGKSDFIITSGANPHNTYRQIKRMVNN